MCVTKKIWYYSYLLYDPRLWCYTQAFNPKLLKLSSLFSINQHPVFLSIFLVRFWRFFIPCKMNKWWVFFLVFLLSSGGFSLIKLLIFSPYFLIEFRYFFTNWIHIVSLWLFQYIYKVFSTKNMIYGTTYWFKFVSKK